MLQVRNRYSGFDTVKSVSVSIRLIWNFTLAGPRSIMQKITQKSSGDYLILLASGDSSKLYLKEQG